MGLSEHVQGAGLLHRAASANGTAAGRERSIDPRSLTREEFGERFEECARVLWTLASGILGDRALAEDVLQEAASIGLQKLQTFDPATDFRAWMGRIVRLCAMNQLRRRSRLRSRTAPAGLLESTVAEAREQPRTVSPEGVLHEDTGQFDDALLAALQAIKPTARAALLLKVVSELEYREIARVLGVPEGTCMSHVHRARGLLRARLGESYPEEAR